MAPDPRPEKMQMSLDNGRLSSAESKRTDILNAALEHFLKDGYTRAAMVDIARDADVSTATLYKYFSSKKTLFTAVTIAAAEKLRDSVADTSGEFSLEEILTKILVDYYAAHREARINDLLRIVIAEATSSPDLAADLYRAVIQMRHHSVKALLDAMVERGVLIAHDTDLGATLAMGMIKEVFVWPAMFDENFRLPTNAMDIAREAIQVYLTRYGTADFGGTLKA